MTPAESEDVALRILELLNREHERQRNLRDKRIPMHPVVVRELKRMDDLAPNFPTDAEASKGEKVKETACGTEAVAKRKLEKTHHRERQSDLDVDPWAHVNSVICRSSGQITPAGMEDIKNRFSDFFREIDLMPRRNHKRYFATVRKMENVDADAFNLPTSVGSAKQERVEEASISAEVIRKRELEVTHHRERESNMASDPWAYMDSLCRSSGQITPADLKEIMNRFWDLFVETVLVCKREPPRKQFG